MDQRMKKLENRNPIQHLESWLSSIESNIADEIEYRIGKLEQKDDKSIDWRVS